MVIENLLTTDEINAIAQRYDKGQDITSLLVGDGTAQEARNFILVCMHDELQHAGIEKPIFVSGQPYATTEDMRRDVRSGKLLISTDFNDAPFWGKLGNLHFRTAHDLHHVQTPDCNFNLWGELCAWGLMSKSIKKHVPDLRLRSKLNYVTFCETVAQVCSLRVNGDFPPQKIVSMYGLEPLKVGRITRNISIDHIIGRIMQAYKV